MGRFILQWFVGVMTLLVVGYGVGLLFYPSMSLDQRDRFAFVSEWLNRWMNSINITVMASIPVVGAILATYALQQLGQLVCGFLF